MSGIQSEIIAADTAHQSKGVYTLQFRVNSLQQILHTSLRVATPKNITPIGLHVRPRQLLALKKQHQALQSPNYLVSAATEYWVSKFCSPPSLPQFKLLHVRETG